MDGDHDAEPDKLENKQEKMKWAQAQHRKRSLLYLGAGGNQGKAQSMMLIIAWIQSVYFVLTGIWPLIDIRSFMAVTGPKTDIWLVRTVGVLVTVIGLTIGFAACTGRPGEEIQFLAIGSALALGAVDVIYSATGVISKIYLLDAVAEAILLVAWGVAIYMQR